MTAVLDASALLAYLQNEQGWEAVEAVLDRAVISSVNWSEVVQKSLAAGVNIEGMREELQALGLTVVPFTLEEAELAARLWPSTRPYGLALGDRACLALGMRLKASVLTADHAWKALNLPVTVEPVR